MFDLLTEKEDAEAASMGWALQHVYDLETARWRVQVLSLHPVHPNAEAAGAHVVGQARVGQPLETKALRLVMGGHQTP